MKLTICTLTKNNCELIIHGMVHVAPNNFYLKVQREMNNLSKEGYKIFYERLRHSKKLDETATQKEKDIAEYFKYRIESMHEIAEICNLSFQTIIKYPEGSINADIEFIEMIKKLSENGFADNSQTRKQMEQMKSRRFREERKQSLKYINTKISIIKLMEYLRMYKLITHRFVNKKDEIILHYRNQVALEIIESHKETHNILYYGEGHISSMIKLFQNNGWELANKGIIVNT